MKKMDQTHTDCNLTRMGFPGEPPGFAGEISVALKISYTALKISYTAGAALKISYTAGAATGSRCTRYPRCSIRRVSRSTVNCRRRSSK